MGEWAKSILDALLKAIFAEMGTPVGWMNLASACAAFYFYHLRKSEFEEMVTRIGYQGIPYDRAVERANQLLGRRIPDDYLMMLVIFVLLISLFLSYRAYVRMLQSKQTPTGNH